MQSFKTNANKTSKHSQILVLVLALVVNWCTTIKLDDINYTHIISCCKISVYLLIYWKRHDLAICLSKHSAIVSSVHGLLLKAMNLKNHNILKVHDLVMCIELQITLHFISNASVLKICLKFLICIYKLTQLYSAQPHLKHA